MLYIIITSYNEPKATIRAIQSFLYQKIKEKFKIIVVDPFPEVEEYMRKKVKDKRIEFFLDPGEGKAIALNMLLETIRSKNNEEIVFFTDGDVFVGKNSVEEILKFFKDKKVGCVTGKPITTDARAKKYGYWSKLLYDGIDSVRKKIDKQGKFFQCSGYLFAIRNNVLKEIPLDVPEDAYIPYIFWKAGYKIRYADKAEVYVKYPDNWKDWIAQRVRTIKAHENIPLVAPDMPRTKSFLNEIKAGAIFTLRYPKNPIELVWTIEFILARILIYVKSFFELKKKEAFNPAWRDVEIKSTKPFD
ncbi:MAG: glycosyltransferase family 2 protein [Nanoarchaeota archaeon]